MKVGLVSILTWRPHVEQLVFVSELLRQLDHETFHLQCGGALPACYNREFKQIGKVRGCSTCVAGSFLTYPVANLSFIRAKHRAALPTRAKEEWSASSAYTLHRPETAAERASSAVAETRESLFPALEIAYGNTAKWIASQRLDAVLCFNGRMAETRAVTEACREAGIPFVTVERPWFSHGLHLTPNESCVSLRELHRLEEAFRNAALTRLQAVRAANIGATRFAGTNALEWRRFNQDRKISSWPATAPGTRILVLPGSRAEWEGHPDWTVGWNDLTTGIDEVIGLVGSNVSVIVRNHPNWATRLGPSTGWMSEQHYSSWARDRGWHSISASERDSTEHLIRDADLVITTGGSSAIQAGLLGKQIVSVAPSPYQAAGFATHVTAPEDLKPLQFKSTEDIIRLTLRYIYTHFFRFPQYVDNIRATTTTDFVVLPGADPRRLERLIVSGKLEADDATIAVDSAEEDEIVELVSSQRWEELPPADSPDEESGRRLSRRAGFTWMGKVRSLLPKGHER